MNNLGENLFSEDIRQAVLTLKNGGIILYPTDTIWGLGCDARNSDAVARIYDIKRRADSKALICLVDSLTMLESVVKNIPFAAEQIVELATSPVTIVYDHGCNVAENLLASDGSLAVRLTREKFSAALCRAFRAPIVSTSANISGCPAPSDFASISDEIKTCVDYICTSRRDETSSAKASSVIKISDNGVFKILRK